jgi:hypothetical protein
MKENKSIREASYKFIDAISKVANLGKDDTAKIVIYSKENPTDTITFSRNIDILNNLEFVARNENDIGDFTAILKNDEIVYNCKIIDYDKEKRSYIFLLKPETAKVLKVIYDDRENSE